MPNENIERLHTALNYFAPTAKEQLKLHNIRVEAERGNTDETAVVQAMLFYINDGLTSGNW